MDSHSFDVVATVVVVVAAAVVAAVVVVAVAAVVESGTFEHEDVLHLALEACHLKKRMQVNVGKDNLHQQY